MIPGSRLGIPSAPGVVKHRRIPNMPITVTVGAAGTATFTWPGVPADEIWTGAVSIPQATPSSVLPILWSATDGGAPIGQWYNSQSSGPLQIRTQLQVTGSGIAAASLVATLQGIATNTENAPPWWPAPTPAPPPGTPQLLPITGVSIAPADTVVTVGSAPVIVGTSVEITCSFADNPAQLEIMWGTVAGSNLLGFFTFDLAASALIKGLVLPNLGPVLTVKAITHAASTGMSLTIFTGLPPIVRPPLLAGGVLLAVHNGALPFGDTSFALPPYIGPAMLSVFLNTGTANSNLYTRVASIDYAGADLGTVHIVPNAVQLAGAQPVIGPLLIHVPPLRNTLTITNGAIICPAFVSLIPLGP